MDNVKTTVKTIEENPFSMRATKPFNVPKNFFLLCLDHYRIECIDKY